MELRRRRVIGNNGNEQNKAELSVYNKKSEGAKNVNTKRITRNQDVALMATGMEFQVNTYTSLDQKFPSITGLNDGGFVVSWRSGGQDGSGLGVYAQVCNADGTKGECTWY